MQLETGLRPAGRWRWDVAGGLWTWDDVTRELLAHTGPASTVAVDVALSRVAEADRPGAQRMVIDLTRRPEEFASVLRVLRPDGFVTPVVLVGRPADADEHTIVGVAVPLAAPYDDLAESAADDPTDQAEHLRRAILSRDGIGQAKGILSARLGIADGDAFDFLRKLSQHTNIKLAELAQRFVAHVLARPEVRPEERARFHRDVLEPFLEIVRGRRGEA